MLIFLCVCPLWSCRYASLYFCTGLDDHDNELLALEVLHRYVELLDKYFGNVSVFKHQEAETCSRTHAGALDVFYVL